MCTLIKRSTRRVPEKLKGTGVYYKDQYIKNPIGESEEGAGRIPNWILPVAVLFILIIVISVLIYYL